MPTVTKHESKGEYSHHQSFKEFIEEQQISRKDLLTVMQAKLCLSEKQRRKHFPKSQLEHVKGTRDVFKITLPIRNAATIKLPLPLPSVGKQWGFAKLLLTIGPDSLLLALRLLLLERSILVLGHSIEEVTTCCQALLEILQPFEWKGIFTPVLPYSMLDFVLSPVPFLAGMAVETPGVIGLIADDVRTMEAMTCGMSLLNLTTGSLLITSESEIANKMALNPNLR